MSASSKLGVHVKAVNQPSPTAAQCADAKTYGPQTHSNEVSDSAGA